MSVRDVTVLRPARTCPRCAADLQAGGRTTACQWYARKETQSIWVFRNFRMPTSGWRDTVVYACVSCGIGVEYERSALQDTFIHPPL